MTIFLYDEEIQATPPSETGWKHLEFQGYFGFGKAGCVQ